MKITDNFHIEELVNPKFIEDHGAEKMIRVFRLYAPNTLAGLEKLREWVDAPIIVNDWKFGGNYINSGLRHPLSPLGATLSAHYYFLAMDCKIKGASIKDIQEDILLNQHAHPNIVRMEDHRDTPTWLHVQFQRRENNQSIEVFRP